MEMYENVMDFEIEFEWLFIMYSKGIYACFAISQTQREMPQSCLGQQSRWLFTEACNQDKEVHFFHLYKII